MFGGGSQQFYEMPGSNGNLGRISAYEAKTLKQVWTFQQRATGNATWAINATEIVTYGANEFYWKQRTDGNYSGMNAADVSLTSGTIAAGPEREQTRAATAGRGRSRSLPGCSFR